MEQAPATSFAQTSFVMKPMPNVFLPLLFGPRSSAASAAEALWGTSVAGAEARPAARACVPDNATPTPTPTPTITPTPTPTVTPRPAVKGIAGKVTFKGGVPQKLKLDLEALNGTDWTTILQTETAADGGYLFQNVPTLGGGQAYRVAFYNTAVAPNGGPDHLWDWLGTKIEAYTTGTWAAGGDFDVADVAIISPADDADVQLPANFCWTPRGIAEDNYKVLFYSYDLDSTASTTWLGNVSCANISGMLQGWPNGGSYVWWVRVGKGSNPDATPFNRGDSYGERNAVLRW